LKSKEAVTELFRTVAPKIANRPGGYTRIIRTGYRLGDNAEMCLIELVDFNEIYTSNDDAKKATTRRSRRGGASKKEEVTATESTEVVAEEVVATEATEAVVEETPATEAPADETPAEEEKTEE
jgi:large subunit ribosomal protein L17